MKRSKIRGASPRANEHRKLITSSLISNNALLNKSQDLQNTIKWKKRLEMARLAALNLASIESQVSHVLSRLSRRRAWKSPMFTKSWIRMSWPYWKTQCTRTSHVCSSSWKTNVIITSSWSLFPEATSLIRLSSRTLLKRVRLPPWSTSSALRSITCTNRTSCIEISSLRIYFVRRAMMAKS